MRAMRGGACAVLVVLLASVVVSGPAAAHTELQSSTPAAGDALDRTPSEVSLVFTEDMDPELSAVVLRVGGEELGRLSLSSGDRGTELVGAVDPGDLPDAGVARWRIDYRVTSRDGHPIVGSVSFRAPTPAGDATTDESAPPSTTPSADSDDSLTEGEESEAEEEAAEGREGGSLVNILVVAGIVVMVLVLALIALRRLGREEELDHERDEPEERDEPDPAP